MDVKKMYENMPEEAKAFMEFLGGENKYNSRETMFDKIKRYESVKKYRLKGLIG